MLKCFYQLASPKRFYWFSTKTLPWVGICFFIALSYGLIGGLFIAPSDYQQGDAFRIIYVHVPSSVMSLAIYLFMALMAAISLIWRIKLAEILFYSSSKIGASLTCLGLLTGALWGQPMWGTWWLWDARLTSELILLFLYFGIIALQAAFPNSEKGIRASSILVLVGSVDLPIIHYSVYWWNTLHQKSTLIQLHAPSIDRSMLYPLLSMIVAFGLFYIIVLLLRARNEILVREYRAAWLKECLSWST